MDLVRSWLAALAVYAVGAWVVAQVAISAALNGALATLGRQVLLLYVPQFLLYVLIAGAAAGLHTRPRRRDVPRHLLAVLPVPLVIIVATEILGVVENDATFGALMASTLATLAGTAAGWQLADLVWRWATTGENERTAYW